MQCVQDKLVFPGCVFRAMACLDHWIGTKDPPETTAPFGTPIGQQKSPQIRPPVGFSNGPKKTRPGFDVGGRLNCVGSLHTKWAKKKTAITDIFWAVSGGEKKIENYLVWEERQPPLLK